MKTIEFVKAIVKDIEVLQQQNKDLKNTASYALFHAALYHLADKIGVTKESLQRVICDNEAAGLLMHQCDFDTVGKKILISNDGLMIESSSGAVINTVEKLLFILKS